MDTIIGKRISPRAFLLYSRIKLIRRIAWRLFGQEGGSFTPSENATRVLVGGDVCFDLEIRTIPYVGAYRLDNAAPSRSVLLNFCFKLWKLFCKMVLSPRYFSTFIYQPFQELLIKTSQNEKKKLITDDSKILNRFNIKYSSEAARFSYPFEKIKPLFKGRDLVLVNLETPLTDSPRVRGWFASDPGYAQAMKDAGISMVNLSNNHVFDAGEKGFFDTLRNLEKAGILWSGAGNNLTKARAGSPVKVKDAGINILSYTQYCNSLYASMAEDYAGILPLDLEIMLEDVGRAKGSADLVFVSLHWGFENQPSVHPRQIEIAHQLIEAGADCIIGHHPHVPHGIEIYRNKPVLYSLGNFIFSHSKRPWGDNYLAEIVIEQKTIKGLLLYPIAGTGEELFQPEPLRGARAEALLHELRMRSAVFKTEIAISDDVGQIKIA
jgi:poly-gamma-glutamate synthesis protein (capsule biosynthesis protein)